MAALQNSWRLLSSLRPSAAVKSPNLLVDKDWNVKVAGERVPVVSTIAAAAAAATTAASLTATTAASAAAAAAALAAASVALQSCHCCSSNVPCSMALARL